ncbi:FAD binding domain-containing protein [Truncatella angustata]|uniref:FAD binding domain-containing protein n=1 Tax=Truncatella angustata TaxID=152316 RepID=A0A9P8UNA2_9PEZI|nr:FAD binding domain-containing protein [Truncatella angustata]KAH6655228.1 FAD binding domain-containing protein [Truncatella angustata]
MHTNGLLPVLTALAGAASVTSQALSARYANSTTCRYGPNDKFWPSNQTWATLDQSVDGRLIKSEPIAQSCYPGDNFDLADCDYVTKMWSDQDFMTTNPIGRPYPYNITCAPVNYTSGDVPTSCSLGINPRYAVNATTRDHILAALKFSQDNNVRLVVTSTGHDLLGRSDGYGSLEIWLRHFRNSIEYQEHYLSASTCYKSHWTGGAIRIDGAWQWEDVYPVAKENNVIVVGGGSVSPGAIGGWPSGGGHGPATRNYGLGADQTLEAEILLANGTIVIADHCHNTDLFQAIRGGGPGYGIILTRTIKVYPNVNTITAHHLAIAPLVNDITGNNSALLDAVTVLLQSFPAMNDAGFSGYGYWFRNFPGVFIPPSSTSGYSHGFWTINKTQEEAEAAFAPVRAALQKLNSTIYMIESWASYTDYWSFYFAESAVYDPTGDTSILTSRLIDPESVADHSTVRGAVEVVSGKVDEYTSNVVLLVSGGQVFKDASDKSSGLHPAWRKSHYALIAGRGVPKNATNEVRQAAQDDITFVKGEALKKLAPDTGGYMNEGDRNDPDWRTSFYGSNYAKLLATKKKYDPDNVFYCTTCVGSEQWVERPDTPLCKT